MNSAKEEFLNNIRALRERGSTAKPTFKEYTEVMEELQRRTDKVCQAFLGTKMTASTLAQINFSILEAMEDLIRRRGGDIPMPRSEVIKCSYDQGKLHAILTPNDFTGTKSFDCGCVFEYRNGFIMPTAPKNKIQWI